MDCISVPSVVCRVDEERDKMKKGKYDAVAHEVRLQLLDLHADADSEPSIKRNYWDAYRRQTAFHDWLEHEYRLALKE